MAKTSRQFGIRSVQLELTLDVEVSCSFRDGAWNLDAVERVITDRTQITFDSVKDALEAHFGERLAELFEQQEG